MFELLFKSFLLGYIVNDAQHQFIAVNLNRAGIGLYVTGGAVSQSMDKVERLMAAGQARDLGHYRQNIAPEGVDLPGVLAAHLFMGVAIKIECREIGIHHQAVPGGID